jgi:hypothetical protein
MVRFRFLLSPPATLQASPVFFVAQMYNVDPSPAVFNPRPISSNPSIIRLESERTLLFLTKNEDHPRNPSLMKGDLIDTSSAIGQNVSDRVSALKKLTRRKNAHGLPSVGLRQPLKHYSVVKELPPSPFGRGRG